MKQQRKNVERAAKRFVKNIVEQEMFGWPPVCVALYYQPVRPKKTEIVQQTVNETTTNSDF